MTQKTTFKIVPPTTPAAVPDHLIKSLALRTMLTRPAFLEKSAWLEHVPFAFWLVEAHQPKVFVELGTDHGASYFAICQAVERLGLDTRCFATGTWRGNEHTAYAGKDIFESVRAYNDTHYSSFSRILRSTFDDALEQFSDGSIDLLHINGLHRPEAVKRGFEICRPKLSKRSVVLLHDSNERERHPGVFKLVEEFRSAYASFEFSHGHRLVVLGVGPEQSDQLKSLFESQNEESSRCAIHEVFGHLGRVCTDAVVANEQQNGVKEMRDEIIKQKEQLNDLQRTLDETRGHLNNRTSELNGIETKLKTQLEQHATEKNRLLEHVSLLQDLRGELREDVIRLNRRLDQTTSDLKERTDSLLKLQLANHLHQRTLTALPTTQVRHKQAAKVSSHIIKPEKRSPAAAAAADAVCQKTASEQQATQLSEAETECKRLNSEIAKLEAELSTVKAEFGFQKQALSSAIQNAEKEAAARAAAEKALCEQKDSDDRLAVQRQQQLEQQVVTIRNLQEERDHLTSKMDALMIKTHERFEEIATLTQMLKDKETMLIDSQERSNRHVQNLHEIVKRIDWQSIQHMRNNEDDLVGNLIKFLGDLMLSSGEFEPSWYLANYPDVAKIGLDPFKHYLFYGLKEARHPNARLSK